MSNTTKILFSLALILGAGLGLFLLQQREDAPQTDSIHSLTTEFAQIIEEQTLAYDAALADARASKGQGRPLMWTYGDADTTVYLLGSFHLLPPNLEWRTPEMDAAFERSDTLLLESDIITPDGISAQLQAVSKFGVYDNGGSLSQTLGADFAKRANDILQEKYGVPLSALDKLHPWFASFSISELMTMELGLDPESGVDRYYGTRRGSRDFQPLEVSEDVFGLLADIPQDYQVEQFMLALETIEQAEPAMNVLMEEWADGDKKGLEAMLIGLMGEDDPTYQALLVQRNRNWIPALKALLDAPGEKFVIVGAAHLVGADSVIAMLQSEGISVSDF